MRMFKRNEPASPEVMAVAARLQAVADRGRFEVLQYPTHDAVSHGHEPRRPVRRPDEIVSESGIA